MMRYIHLQKYVRPMKRMNVKREVEMMMMKTVSVQECAAFSFQHIGGRQRHEGSTCFSTAHTQKDVYNYMQLPDMYFRLTRIAAPYF